MAAGNGFAEHFDVVVIGGGHAGTEAAWAAGHLGAKTALITFQREAIGRMSCNPAIGGIGKGQMVREIDALGGIMGRAADAGGIQFRMLNRSKGPAVQSPRCQADRKLYARAVQELIARCPNLTVIEAGVDDLLSEPVADGDGGAERRITGVVLHDGRLIAAGAVIVTSGTFLRGLMHTGEEQTVGGRVGEQAAVGLSGALGRLGIALGRMKTGTPPRVDRGTVDLSVCDEQPGDDEPAPFSYMTERIAQPQIQCWITWTNARVHELIRANLHRAPMYSGQIESRGPRYCPSIEDKVVRFADKDRHQLFLEPEGYESDWIYVNGISTSLPRDVQAEMVASVRGLERARIVQWGYAVEYDFAPPEQLDATMMVKRVAGLYLAGQIAGTSGYEEAAGQGLVAGVNAARRLAGADGLVLGRDEAYIGVMIDDLVTRGVSEPYRMFTSRAEYRLHLRYDNADQRLTPIGRSVGLVSDERWERFEACQRDREALRAALGRERFDGRTLVEWLRRPEEDGERFRRGLVGAERVDVWSPVVTEIKYAGYLERQARTIASFRELEGVEIPEGVRFDKILHLRREAAERLSAVKPRSVGQASRVDGIRPSDISILLVALRRGAELSDGKVGADS